MIKCKMMMISGLINPIEFTHILSATTNMRTIAHDLMARLSVDLPYPYASTLGYLVHIVVFLQVSIVVIRSIVVYMIVVRSLTHLLTSLSAVYQERAGVRRALPHLPRAVPLEARQLGGG